jgi:hypothetical protein
MVVLGLDPSGASRQRSRYYQGGSYGYLEQGGLLNRALQIHGEQD